MPYEHIATNEGYRGKQWYTWKVIWNTSEPITVEEAEDFLEGKLGQHIVLYLGYDMESDISYDINNYVRDYELQAEIANIETGKRRKRNAQDEN